MASVEEARESASDLADALSSAADRRAAERRRLRASLATIRSSQGRNRCRRSKPARLRKALTNASWAASSASAADPVTR